MSVNVRTSVSFSQEMLKQSLRFLQALCCVPKEMVLQITEEQGTSFHNELGIYFF